MRTASERCRVLVLLPSLGRGGAEAVALRVMAGLNRERFEPCLVVTEDVAREWDAIPSDVRVFRLRKRSRWDFPRLVLGLRRLIKTEAPDVVLSLIYYTNIMAVLATRGQRHVRTVISERSYPRAYLQHERYALLKRRLMRATYRHADTVTVISTGIRDVLTEDFGVDPAKVAVTPNPVDIDRVAHAADQPLPTDLPTGEGPLIVAVGRLVRAKNFELLIEAAARLHAIGPVRVAIVGDGPLRAELMAKATERGLGASICFAGHRENPWVWMRAADVVALTSAWEGFGSVIVEAMACGRAVVATDCPSGPRDIIEHEHSGLLVPPHDAAAFSEALQRVLNDKDLRRRLETGARSRAPCFNTARAVAHYAAVLDPSTGEA